MRFATSVAALIASAAVSSAASITFWTLDNVERTVYFTCNPGMDDIAPVTLNNQANTTVDLPDTWYGNFYAVPDGEPNVPGMLGEVSFNTWSGLTFFDVSAIVAPNDINNVKQLFPAEAKEPMSGCANFPCNNVYWASDDLQTKSTNETDLVCTLGAGSIGYTFSEAE